LPELAATFAKIGNHRVRAWGTIGGNLVAGDPRHDGPPLLAAMGAHGIVVNAGGQHRAEVARLVSGLDPRDLLTEIRIPAPGAGEGIGFEKLFYSAGDYALVSAAVGLRLATDGQVAAARLALSGAAFGCAQVVLVQPPNPGPGLPIDVVRAAAERAAAEAPAVDDFRGSADYKRHVAEVLLARALAAAGVRAEARGELS
jgi:carbon-monoxide dehydrogenase medium subunit